MVWKEEFKLPISPQKDSYDVLAIQAWHRDAGSSGKPSLIGTARIPVPWAFNGYVFGAIVNRHLVDVECSLVAATARNWARMACTASKRPSSSSLVRQTLLLNI